MKARLRKAVPNRYCSRSCSNRRGGTPHQLFWAKVEKDGPVPDHMPDLGACWVWTGSSPAEGGYGYFQFDGRMQSAHRVGWKLQRGPIPTHDSHHGMCVLHRCDNPSCVRGSHLFLGTNRVNMADMVTKGRQSRGEGAAKAKLRVADVVAIRSLYAAGGVSQRKLGEGFGVHGSQVCRIINREFWSHIGQCPESFRPEDDADAGVE